MTHAIWKKLPFKISITVIIISSLFLILILYVTQKGCSTLSQIAWNFKTGKVVTEFYDYVTEVKGMQRLQAASLKTTDVFTRIDSKSILWELIELPDVKVEIKLPVEYTYYLDLKDKWEFEWDEKLMHVKVIAPKLRPNTPAVNISEMKVTVLKGSFLRDVEEVKDSLFRELTPKLTQLSYEKIELVKENARKEVSGFVSDWFLNNYFRAYKVMPKIISIRFEDEADQYNTSPSIKVKVE